MLLPVLQTPSLSKRRLDAKPSVVNYICGKSVGLTTGLPSFDQQLKGMQGLVCVMGEPKVNKSTLVLQWALHHAMQGNPAYYLDCENGLPLLSKRVLCHWRKCSEAQLATASEEQVRQVLTKFCDEVPFFACDDVMPYEDLAVEVEQLVEQGKPTMLILDSVQWLNSKQLDKRLKIDEWVAKLDSLKLAHRPNLTIICISEKNRSGYKTASMASAKESGSIEYKAEQLFDLQLDEESGNVILQCVANRHGPRGARVMLEKVMSNPADQHSFTFTMRESSRRLEL